MNTSTKKARPLAVYGKGSVSDETFDDFLAEQGLLQACENQAIKEIIADQLAAEMKGRGLIHSNATN
jgi:hypothetical protein